MEIKEILEKAISKEKKEKKSVTMKYLGKFETREKADEFKKGKNAFIKKQTYKGTNGNETFWYVYSKK